MNFSEGRQGGCGRTPRTPLNPPLLARQSNVWRGYVMARAMDSRRKRSCCFDCRSVISRPARYQRSYFDVLVVVEVASLLTRRRSFVFRRRPTQWRFFWRLPIVRVLEDIEINCTNVIRRLTRTNISSQTVFVISGMHYRAQYSWSVQLDCFQTTVGPCWPN